MKLRPSSPACDTAIVLGAGVNDNGSITHLSRTRVDKALSLYRDGRVKKIIFSGGRTNPNSHNSEAESMYDYATGKGVTKSDIILETHARNTVENAYYTKLILEANHWRRNIVVTNGFHVIRTKYIFSKLFGREYATKYTATGSGLGLGDFSRKLWMEVYFQYMCWRLLKGIRIGNHEALANWLKRTGI